MRSDASQTHVEASALQDAQQLSARHVDSLRHEIFHQTKAQVKGLSQGERAPLYTHTDQRKILLGYVGPVKAKWIIDLGCGVATGEGLACTSKQGYKKRALIPTRGFLKAKMSPVGECSSYLISIKFFLTKKENSWRVHAYKSNTVWFFLKTKLPPSGINCICKWEYMKLFYKNDKLCCGKSKKINIFCFIFSSKLVSNNLLIIPGSNA